MKPEAWRVVRLHDVPSLYPKWQAWVLTDGEPLWFWVGTYRRRGKAIREARSFMRRVTTANDRGAVA